MTLGLVLASALVVGVSCETVDPGPEYVTPSVQYDANYFYCVVEPQIIMGGLTKTPCGDDGSHGCHYSDKVPGMPLQALAQPVACNAGVPVNPGDVAAGTAPALNLASVSLQMSPIVMDAQIYILPGTANSGHPVQVFSAAGNPDVLAILEKWAASN